MNTQETDEQLKKERQEWLKNYEQEKQAEFAKNKAKMDVDYDSLPMIFQQRIDKFRKTNPRFRIDYERYELFCCKEAILIAEAIHTKEELENFIKLDFKEQKKIVPELSDGHSGNTFGMACRLAYWYLTEMDNVVKEHGALTPLVGCESYGCPHPAEKEQE